VSGSFYLAGLILREALRRPHAVIAAVMFALLAGFLIRLFLMKDAGWSIGLR
jgi:hypothetical protein